MVKKNIPVGIKKKRGFPTTPRPRKVKQKKKNVQRNRFISDLVQEVCGYAPYEGRLMELMSLQGATHSAEKRPLRFAKKRLGSIRRAKQKLKEVAELKLKIQRRQQELLREEQEAKERAEKPDKK